MITQKKTEKEGVYVSPRKVCDENKGKEKIKMTARKVLLLLLLLLLATMTLNQVQSFRINHQAGSHYINI